MKAIELRAALIAANDINLNGADALIESSILKQLIESCKVRIDEIEPEAKALAEQELAEIGETEVFDIVGKSQKYIMPEGVEYRRLAKEQADHKKASAKLTRDMKTIMDDFPANHPNIAPDDIKTVLKCLD